MMEFYSHPKRDETGKKNGGKKIVEHTNGVTQNAFHHFFTGTSFSLDLEIDILLKLICQFHDLGKYTTFFQNYLFDLPHDPNLKQHARFGAHAILNWLSDKQDLAYISYFIVKNHHRSLHSPNLDTQDGLLDKGRYEDISRIFKAQVEDVSKNALPVIEHDLNFQNLERVLNIPERKPFCKFVNSYVADRPEIARYFLINYLFSLLIEADKLDASQTPAYLKKTIFPGSVEQFISGRSAPDNEHNRLRTAVRLEVIRCLKEENILGYKLFLLTAPTGIGKTLTALDFAIRLKARLPNNPQIIVGLPFINIIEQTLDEYKKVFDGQNIDILGHYQYADIFGDSAKREADEESSDADYGRRRMEIETWQSDIVVTSFVQLLQTMVANKNKILMKFNHLAGAIVIMDEVQSLRLEQVPFIGAVLNFMAKFLGTRFILMTATKPLIFELTEREILKKILPNESLMPVKQLLSNPIQIFERFHRTQIVPILDKQLHNSIEFITLFKEKWKPGSSCLIVCNTVNRSIEVYELIAQFFEESKYAYPLFYLSTNVLPAHRLEIIQDIKKRMKEGAVLISTQVVEAGVDLDFDMGFRDLGPIDSIVQVAGRINRENSEERRYSPLYVMNLGDCKSVYGSITASQAEIALGKAPILEPDYYQIIEKYFWNISDRSAFVKSQQYFRGLLHLQYDEPTIDEGQILPISSFKVIEESPNTVSVFIEWDVEAKAARQAWLEMYNPELREHKWALKAAFEQKYKKIFHLHVLAIPKWYVGDLPRIDPGRSEMNFYVVEHSKLGEWYNRTIGFNRKRAKAEDKKHSISL